MITVHFYLMRHGEKDGDKLTPLGVRQVEASAARHLSDVEILYAYSSGKNRADETARLAALMSYNGSVPVHQEDGFGFAWYADDPEVPPFLQHDAVCRLLKDRKADTEITAYDWLEFWTPAAAIRGRLIQTLLDISLRVTIPIIEQGLTADMTINIVVGTHGPTGELAAPTPKAMPTLNFADIALYTVEVSNEDLKPRIVTCQHLPCPAVS